MLALLVAIGLALRVFAMVAWWPVATTLADSWPYAYYAGTDAFADPQHPAGYSLFLALGGVLTHNVAVFGILQALLGIASALLLFAGVRRMCGSPWPGLIGAAVILLGADQVYLERSIMSETLFTFLLMATIYATARALESSQLWHPWPIAVGVLAVFAGATRSAGFLMIPAIALALVLIQPRPWLSRWRPVVAFMVPVGALLVGLAVANNISHSRFEIAPTPGWHLYSRVAPIADCSQFDPPAGTSSLCERTPTDQRMGMDEYLFGSESPAAHRFGNIGVTGGAGDEQLGAFARKVIVHQPRATLETVWPDLKAYFFSDDYDWRPGRGTDLDGQVDWSKEWPPEGERVTQSGMEEFFDPFSVERDRGALGFLHSYQRVFRFGATALTIATLLTLLGLFVGPRRNRVAVFVLGIASLAMFLIPTFTAIYSGRYTVPLAGPLAAAAAIAAMSGWDLAKRRRPIRT